MERYIGLDVHAASTTFAVIGESGKRLGSHVVETNGQALVEPAGYGRSSRAWTVAQDIRAM